MRDIQVKSRYEDEEAIYYSFYFRGSYLYGRKRKGDSWINIECQKVIHFHKELSIEINRNIKGFEIQSVFAPSNEMIKFYYGFTKLFRMFVESSEEEKIEMMQKIYESGMKNDLLNRGVEK